MYAYATHVYIIMDIQLNNKHFRVQLVLDGIEFTLQLSPIDLQIFLVASMYVLLRVDLPPLKVTTNLVKMALQGKKESLFEGDICMNLQGGRE